MNALLAAAAPLLAGAFVVWGSPVTWLEVIAFALSIAMVVLNIRVDPLGWPLAIDSAKATTSSQVTGDPQTTKALASSGAAAASSAFNAARARAGRRSRRA